MGLAAPAAGRGERERMGENGYSGRQSFLACLKKKTY